MGFLAIDLEQQNDHFPYAIGFVEDAIFSLQRIKQRGAKERRDQYLNERNRLGFTSVGRTDVEEIEGHDQWSMTYGDRTVLYRR
jgi:hypothetical protein